jgi:tetratricopeptide (TPR) repeat protein
MPDKPACISTHPLIESGTCPWCEVPILNGLAKPDTPLKEVVSRRWNVDAMLAALDSDDRHMGLKVISCLFRHGFDIERMSPVLRKALQNRHKTVRLEAVHAIRRQGGRLTAEQADYYQQRSVEDRDDPVLHLLLLRYYFLPSQMNQAARKFRQQHVFWLIENQPELAARLGPDLYLDPKQDAEASDRARKLWLEQFEKYPNDAALLGNAAPLFILDDPALGKSLLSKALELEPDNPDWHDWLAEVHSLQARRQTGTVRQETAALALSELVTATALRTDGPLPMRHLPDMAQTAFDAGQYGKAKQYAETAIRECPSDSDAVHWGNTILGRLALRDGDIATAKRHLIESARVTGSPVLVSFGPSMTLAKELIDRGERDVVINYLTMCNDFWQTDDHRPDQWIRVIQQGGVPDFGYKGD